eukprot:2829655-Rhodomonas_salina.2
MPCIVCCAMFGTYIAYAAYRAEAVSVSGTDVACAMPCPVLTYTPALYQARTVSCQAAVLLSLTCQRAHLPMAIRPRVPTPGNPTQETAVSVQLVQEC